ncbi:hypothetical protein CUMW_010390 [Citrus unshiu]|nr:hypothetical protein CUMW_010390 [Citrus unshiu]
MSSPYNSNWIFDCGLLDGIGVSGGDLPSLDPPEVLWSSSTSNPPLSAEFDDSFGNLDAFKETGSRKRVRSGSCSASGSKACREKMRRDRLNDRHALNL